LLALLGASYPFAYHRLGFVPKTFNLLSSQRGFDGNHIGTSNWVQVFQWELGDTGAYRQQ